MEEVSNEMPRGPLAGIRLIEFAGIGPAPFGAMMLADHGAEVIRVERPGTPSARHDPLLRSRKSVVLDLKSDTDRVRLRQIVRGVDGIIEGFRPGVMERLGLGPDILLEDNPKLVYGRMTGWGQEGPDAHLAGHDINYIAVNGTLAALGRLGEKPTPPINLLGDFGGGGMLLAFGMLAALLSVRNGARGQVVDCAMVDGSALLMSMMWGFRAAGAWSDERGANLLDTGAPFYDTYQTADGKYVALGAIEPQFYAQFRKALGLDGCTELDRQDEPCLWSRQKELIADAFRRKTRDELSALFEGSDACVTAILGFDDALKHPHNVARGTFVEIDGVVQPAPAPRYSTTPCARPLPPRESGADQHILDAVTD